MTPDTPPVLYISADTSDLTTRYKATPRMHPGADAWIPRDAVRVKPLEWEYHEHRGIWTAQGVFGIIYTVNDGQWWRTGMLESKWVAGDNDAQKAAAQADFDARIMSALAALPAPDEGEQDEGE